MSEKLNKRRYYERNKAAYLARNKKSKAKLLAWYRELKRGKACVDCQGVFDPVCMDYHHDEGEKTDNIARMVCQGKGRATIEAEIAKCVLVCANCHRLRHHTSS